MATPTRGYRPVRTLITLGAATVAMFAAIFAGVTWSDATWAPKLALDLEGGTQLILTPVTETDEAVTPEVINQAIAIIRQRVDASGVAEAEISSQGGGNIVVGLPGEPDEATLDLVRTPAVMDFRSVLVVDYGMPAPDEEQGVEGLPTDAELEPESLGYSDLGWITQEVQRDFNTLDCTDPNTMLERDPAPADRAMVTCDSTGLFKYILGPIEISGTHIATASSGLATTAQGVSTGQWAVNLEFDGEGSAKFRETTTRIRQLPSPQNQFAVVLDEVVITAPSVEVIIPNGEAQITGDFTRIEAASLAQQLSFGALPLRFEVQSEQQVSATLGSEQLQRGLLAGGLGLLLVVIYSLFQYRALGLVTVGSLVVATILTYGVITVLSWTQGYRLSLPGVAGLIVAIGITADSFIVYFERIRDELRDGRTLPAAVEKGWARAKRTILASDAVNFLAAVVLYSLAVGGVRGFAFTLGLTTLIDLLIVFLFTHPVMVLLAKTKFFGQGHPLSGLDPRRLGVGGTRYVGRGKVVQAGERASKAEEEAEPAEEAPAAPVPAFGGGTPTMTIAERRAAAKAAAEQNEGNES